MFKNGFARSHLHRSMSAESFLKHVVTTIERQLKEWDLAYEVMVLKLSDYFIWVTGAEESYEVAISADETEQLQKRSPYALDRHLLLALQAQGLEIQYGFGDYIDYVLQE